MLVIHRTSEHSAGPCPGPPATPGHPLGPVPCYPPASLLGWWVSCFPPWAPLCPPFTFCLSFERDADPPRGAWDLLGGSTPRCPAEPGPAAARTPGERRPTGVWAASDWQGGSTGSFVCVRVCARVCPCACGEHPCDHTSSGRAAVRTCVHVTARSSRR